MRARRDGAALAASAFMRVVVAAAVLALLSGCGLMPEGEVGGPQPGTARAPDPISAGTAATATVPAAGTSLAGDAGGAGDSPPLSDPTPAASAPLARGLSIAEVALFQGVKVSLAKAGTKVTTRSMPVIAGRDGLLRVYVTPDASWTPRSVVAELHLVSGGKGLPIARDTKIISGASAEADLASTFDFDVPGASLPAGVEYFVQLLDATAAPVATATANDAQYPRAGATEAIDAVAGAAQLKVVIVPIRYGADGSQRVPDTSAPALEPMRSRALELYPVPAVEFSVHAPIDWAGPIAPNGDGWAEVLADVTQLRLTEKPSADTYYYGVFAPAVSGTAYCPGSCVVGLSNLAASTTDATQRASVGVLYPNSAAVIGTLAHEVGHAHGRRHAPCGGAAGIDTSFPYPDATIGTWGYSIVSKQLKNPAAATPLHDFMSYCGPEWTSDYTFKGLFDRGRALQSASVSRLTAESQSRAVRTLLEGADGTIRWHARPAVWTDAEFGGEPRAVTFVGAGGVVLGTATAHRYPYDHLGGGTLLVPEGPIGTLRVVVDGAGEIAAPATF